MKVISHNSYPNIENYGIGLLPCRFLRHRSPLGSTWPIPPAAASVAATPSIAGPPTSPAAGRTGRREGGSGRDAREPAARRPRARGGRAAEREAREREEEEVAGHGEASVRGSGNGGAAERGRWEAAADEDVVRGRGGEGPGAGGDGLGEGEEGRGWVHPLEASRRV